MKSSSVLSMEKLPVLVHGKPITDQKGESNVGGGTSVMNKAFGLFVCLRGVGFGADVLERLSGFGEIVGLVAGAGVAHHPRDRCVLAFVIGDCGLKQRQLR